MNQEQNAILQVAALAALCDGQQTEAERAALLKLAEGATGEYEAALRLAQAGEIKLADVARSIVTPEGRQLAFEAAVAVCTADGGGHVAEQAFLGSLRAALDLPAAAAAGVVQQAAAIGSAPVTGSAPAGADGAALDKTILDAAILNGALELLPETLASMAILPLQMKLVYRIGKAHGYDLGREHIRDFVATLGVGMTAQFLEGFARKLLGGLFGGVGRQAASSGMAFISTYAIGQAARRYYAGGRKLEAIQLRETYQSMTAQARTVFSGAQGEIQKRLGDLRGRNLADLIKSA